jgi:hypothetical protein
MKNIYVDEDEDYPECPLRTDLNSCSVVKNSDINSCPVYKDDLNVLPDWCPLLHGGICIQIK